MKITVKTRYLVFPVHSLAAMRTLSFCGNGKCLYSLDIRLEPCHPDFYSYVDIARYMGQTLDISAEPDIALSFRETDEIDLDGLYQEPLRPQLHFSTKSGWLNDPNGLILLNDTYHMFYQYNPTEPQLANCLWGHAVSRDLFHWKELPAVLFPDERGRMASGSAIVDYQNLLGKNNENGPAAVLFYTTGRHPQVPCCQNISYSTDDFETIHHYSGNPIIPHIEAKNRDPKVSWCPELNAYVMALYMQQGDYCIFRSGDLANWEELTRIHMDGEREVPDLFPLTDETGECFWILMGCIDRYIVGKFTNGNFVPVQPIQRLHYGFASYAGQTFNNLPNGRIVRICWQRWSLPVTRFNGQMSVPMELSLRKINGKFYVRAYPVKEIEGLICASRHYDLLSVTPDNSFSTQLVDAPQLIRIKIKRPAGGSLYCTAFGRTFCLDLDRYELRMVDYCAPLSISRDDIELTAVIDRCSFELFADGGTSYLAIVQHAIMCDRSKPYFTVASNSSLLLDTLEIHTLTSIWEQKEPKN